ncbi:unnamed protein product [Brassica napus]|uniref:(rape) hypothetical protein n=2 Tax=Brassica TaxID=3705 RepID=A0A816Y8E7_BRANA|nr:unnamed protein product [Brassica napus]
MICCISMRRYGETELLNLERQSPSWIRSGRLLQLRLAEELSDSDPKNSGGGSSELSLPVTLPLDSYASAHENPRQTHYPENLGEDGVNFYALGCESQTVTLGAR